MRIGIFPKLIQTFEFLMNFGVSYSTHYPHLKSIKIEVLSRKLYRKIKYMMIFSTWRGFLNWLIIAGMFSLSRTEKYLKTKEIIRFDVENEEWVSGVEFYILQDVTCSRELVTVWFLLIFCVALKPFEIRNIHKIRLWFFVYVFFQFQFKKFQINNFENQNKLMK